MGRLHRHCRCMQGVHGGCAADPRSVLGQFKLTCIWVRSLTFSGCISLETRDNETHSYVRHHAGGTLCPTHLSFEIVGPPMMTIWLQSAEPTSGSRLCHLPRRPPERFTSGHGSIPVAYTRPSLPTPGRPHSAQCVVNNHEFVWTWRVLGGQQNRPWWVFSG